MCKILDRINTPKDLKVLSRDELVQLCAEIRQQMLLRLSATGGHVGSNLAVIEATVALHYVFEAPVDKIIFDVSHQCYTHKLLTGRKAAYTNPERFSSVSGFTNPAESEYDIFSIGHTSTAISLACGLAKGRDVKGENHGGLYQNLRLLRETDGKSPCNIFRALGFDYSFVRNGNDFQAVADAFQKVKGTDHPVVIHMCTVKGKGYQPAETDKENWHYMGPFDIGTGRPKPAAVPVETYEALTAAYLADKMRKDTAVTAITADCQRF